MLKNCCDCEGNDFRYFSGESFISTVILKSVAEGLRHKYLTIGWAGDVSPHSKNIHICARASFWRLWNVPIYCNISNDGYKKRKGVWPAQVTIGKLNCKKRHRFNLNTGKRKKQTKQQKSQQERREGRTLAWGIFKLPVSHLIKITISLWSYFLTFTFLIFSWMWHIDFMFSIQTQETRNCWSILRQKTSMKCRRR